MLESSQFVYDCYSHNYGYALLALSKPTFSALAASSNQSINSTPESLRPVHASAVARVIESLCLKREMNVLWSVFIDAKNERGAAVLLAKVDEAL